MLGLVVIAVNDKTGIYRGDVVDGLPDGNGYFKTQNSLGVTWVYNGDWQEGTCHGYGTQTWYSDTNSINRGNFSHGYFRPTWGEFLYSLGTRCNFHVSDKSIQYIDSHEQYFSTKYSSKVSDSLIDYSFDYTKFKKNSTLYEGKLVTVPSATVIQIFSYESWGRNYEFAILETDNGELYYGYFNGKTDIEEGMRIEATLLPLDWSTYENTAGTQKWAVFCAYTNTYGDAYTPLQQGDKGDDVLQLKLRLRELGYIKENASLSKTYNSTTTARIKLFQSVNGLPETGDADSRTLKLLFSQNAKKNPSPLD